MTATYTNQTTTLESSAQSFAVDAIHAAMLEAVERFAAGAELSDTNGAARQPVSMGAAYHDLCAALGIPVPAIALQAVS